MVPCFGYKDNCHLEPWLNQDWFQVWNATRGAGWRTSTKVFRKLALRTGPLNRDQIKQNTKWKIWNTKYKIQSWHFRGCWPLSIRVKSSMMRGAQCSPAFVQKAWLPEEAFYFYFSEVEKILKNVHSSYLSWVASRTRGCAVARPKVKESTDS